MPKSPKSSPKKSPKSSPKKAKAKADAAEAQEPEPDLPQEKAGRGRGSAGWFGSWRLECLDGLDGGGYRFNSHSMGKLWENDDKLWDLMYVCYFQRHPSEAIL